MLPPKCWPQILFAFVVALLVGTLLGSIVQTQINLLELRNLGVNVDMTTRLATTAQDLLHFGPVYGAIFGASFAVSQALAVAVAKWAGQRWLIFLCFLGAACGLWAAMRSVDAFATHAHVHRRHQRRYGHVCDVCQCGCGRMDICKPAHAEGFHAST